MKALDKERLTLIIQYRFRDDEVIFKDDFDKIWEEFGDDWFIDEETKSWVKND